MPVDASIYSMIQPQPRSPGPLELAGQAFTIKHLIDQGDLSALQRQQLQQSINDDQAVRGVFAGMQPGQTIKDLLPSLMQASPARAAVYQKQATDDEKARADLEKTRAETLGIRTKQLRDQLAVIQDDNALGAWAKEASGVYGMQAIQGMPQSVSDPRFTEWKQNRLMTADEIVKRLAPQYHVFDTGSGFQVGQINPQAPGGATAPPVKTVAPGESERLKLERARLGVQAATADPFGTLGIRSIAQGAGALPAAPGGQQPAATPGAQAAALPSGDAYLSTLPKNMADQVKALAEGRMQFPGGFALKSPYWQQMIQMVGQYDPNFDAVNYNARAGVRKAFTSGREAQSLNALNTVMGHLDELDKSLQALDNSDYPLLNKATNYIGSQVSPDRKAKLNSVKIATQAVSSELERAYRGTGGNMTEIEEWKKAIDAADSPEAQRAALTQATKLLHSKIEALGDQYSKGMGTTKNGIELLSPKAQKTFARLSGGSQEQSGTIGQPSFSRDQIDAELRRRGVIK